MSPKILLIVIILIFLGLGIFWASKLGSERKSSDPIVFFGDSITAGVGAQENEDFPTLVGQALKVSVVNAGVSGDTTAMALSRLETDVIFKNPKIVVVELGGNDFLQKVSFEETKTNFEKIIGGLSAKDTKIVILGMRTALFNDQYESLQGEIAKKYKAIFVPNILKGIITDSSLMTDEIHPNAKGYKVIAERLVKVLKPLL